MLSTLMRLLLAGGGISNAIYMINKLKSSKIALTEAIFWLWVSIVIALFGIFPIIPIVIAKVLGVESPANLVYLLFLGILLIKTFLLSLKMSELEKKIKKMNQEVALAKYKENYKE